MSVITVSREFGASGTYIALKTAAALGYTCYDQQILNSIAEKMGKDTEQIEPFDQSTYNRISVFFHEALESISKGGWYFIHLELATRLGFRRTFTITAETIKIKTILGFNTYDKRAPKNLMP